ncbi:MAG: hypothetical protein H7Z76_13130, partial [Methylotenera sp.]|nr:hypothetical protein [Flavobacterium sp.]
MKTKLSIFLFSVLVFVGNAQTQDSISTTKNQNKLSYKHFIAPVALVTTGAL